MLIKDKITPQLKNRFIEEINNTIKDGREHGFLMCVDKEGKLSATQSCKGVECTINLESLMDQCPVKVQGDFHTHPHGAQARQYIKKNLGRDVPFEAAKKIINDIAKDMNISIEGPSYGDLLGTLILRYEDKTLGTTCTGSDINPDEVECWSTKNEIKEIEADEAMIEYFDYGAEVSKSPPEWVKPLFDKEKIDLKV